MMGCTTSVGRSPFSRTSDNLEACQADSRRQAIVEVEERVGSTRTLEDQAMELLSQYPELSMGKCAEQLGCSIRNLQKIDRFVKAYQQRWEFVSAFLNGETQFRPTESAASDAKHAGNSKGVVSIKRKRLTVIDEVSVEGVLVSEDLADVPADADPILPALNVRQMSGREDFVSAPDAKPISKDDICNIEAISAVELRETLQRIARRLQLDVIESDPLAPEANWGDGWKAGDERWTLTPHALRKLRPRK